jgi:hypothetical protein
LSSFLIQEGVAKIETVTVTKFPDAKNTGLGLGYDLLLFLLCNPVRAVFTYSIKSSLLCDLCVYRTYRTKTIRTIRTPNLRTIKT